MKTRYLSGFDKETVVQAYDAVVIGTGIAGLFAALNIDPSLKVLVITKDVLEWNNSNLAQGGIAACVDSKDDFEVHYQDTLRAGSYHNESVATHMMIEEAPISIEKLIEYGVKLDRDEKGKLEVTREGGHTNRRILHAKDATGREIIRALGEELRKRSNITLRERVFAIDIITVNNRSLGVTVVDNSGNKALCKGGVVVIASGGIGSIYQNSTNPKIATGDGIAMAYRAGAIVRDMEFVQFHPTALYNDESGQKFLISEAVRGEGAVLRNIHGEAFMENLHEMKDLAPRDIVARSIINEIQKTNIPYLYLDITHKGRAYIMERFPTIFEKCMSIGIDISKEYIPVAPAEHYLMGGIESNLNGETSIKGLYACGECARTGVHGANRLASNSLLEGAVFGYRAAMHINNEILNYENANINISLDNSIANDKKAESNIDLKHLHEEIALTMDKYVAISRNQIDLTKAKEIISGINDLLDENPMNDIYYYELMNMATVALLIIEAALERKKSLGAHYRIDDMEGSVC